MLSVTDSIQVTKETLRMRKSVYQMLPPIFRVPGNETIITDARLTTLDWINAGNIKFLPVLQCTNSSHNVKTSISLLELGKRLFQPEVTPWPPWEVPGSPAEELLLVPNLATLLFVGQCAALRFLDRSVNNLTTQLISCTQCILYQSKVSAVSC